MGGTPPPPLRTKFSANRGLRIWGVPPPPFTDKIRKVVFEVFPKGELIKLGTQHRHIIHALEVIRIVGGPLGSGEPDDGSGVGTGESGGSGDSGKGFKLF